MNRRLIMNLDHSNNRMVTYKIHRFMIHYGKKNLLLKNDDVP
jgi:hypothetical protein